MYYVGAGIKHAIQDFKKNSKSDCRLVNHESETSQNIAVLKNAGIMPRPNTIITTCKLADGEQATKISDVHGNEIIFEIKNGSASIAGENVVFRGAYNNLFQYCPVLSEAQIAAANKRQKTLDDSYNKSLKKHNNAIANEKKEKAAEEKKARVNNIKNQEVQARKDRVQEVSRQKLIDKIEAEKDPLVKAIAVEKQAKFIKNVQAARQVAEDKHTKDEKAFEQKIIKIKTNFHEIEQKLFEKGIERQDHLLPTSDQKSGFVFKGITAPDGTFLRNKNADYLSTDGSTWKLIPGKDQWDVTVLNGSHIRIQTAEPHIPATPVLAESAKIVASQPVLFKNSQVYENIKLLHVPADVTHDTAKEKPFAVPAVIVPLVPVVEQESKETMTPLDALKTAAIGTTAAIGSVVSSRPPVDHTAVADPTVWQGVKDAATKAGPYTPYVAAAIAAVYIVYEIDKYVKFEKEKKGLKEKLERSTRAAAIASEEFAAAQANLARIEDEILKKAQARQVEIDRLQAKSDASQRIADINKAELDKLIAEHAVKIAEMERVEKAAASANSLHTTVPCPQPPLVLEHPMPPIEKPVPGECGKPVDIDRRTDTAHIPHPDLEKLDKQPKGCGQPTKTPAELAESLILHAEKVGDKTWIDKDGKIRKIGDLSDVDLRYKEKNIAHIFTNEEGHLLDTPKNRQRIIDLIKDPSKYLGPDKHGNWWYGDILPDGTQLWGSIWGDVIGNCGLNEKPIEYNKDTGLCRPVAPNNSNKNK
jgi:hypothetical protein